MFRIIIDKAVLDDILRRNTLKTLCFKICRSCSNKFRMGMSAVEAGLQRGTLVSLPVLVAVATMAAVFKSVQNRQPEIGNRKFLGSCSRTRTTSSEPAQSTNRRAE